MTRVPYQFHPYLPGIDHPYLNGVIPAAVNDGWLKQYTPEIQQELADRFGVDVMEALHQDYQAIHELRFGGVMPAVKGEQKLYVATAGSPCSGKSWELDEELERVDSDPRYANLVQVDPDRWVMLQMGMYKDLLAHGATAEEAYNFARPASNIIANMFLNECVARGFNIAHGTTMTGPHAASLLKSLRTAGYHTRILATYAPVEARLAMRDHRINTEGFYQVTPEDFVTKADAFMERMPVYCDPSLVCDLYLLYKDDVLTPARMAARYITGQSEHFNHGALARFVKAYNEYRDPFVSRAQNSDSATTVIPMSWMELTILRSSLPTPATPAPDYKAG